MWVTCKHTIINRVNPQEITLACDQEHNSYLPHIKNLHALQYVSHSNKISSISYAYEGYICLNKKYTYWLLYLVHLASTGLVPFCLQNCLNSSWHRLNKVLETFLRDFGPYWHNSITLLMTISRSTTSQRCSIGLRSGDCGGHLSKVNSLSCSRNRSEMIWALWHGALSCWK